MPRTPFFSKHPRTPRVLVVEDDPEVRAYVVEVLGGLPVRVSEAVDGQDALDQAAALGEDLDLVVTDLHMPRLDGRALTEALHADARWAEVPVLLITGESARARDGPHLRKPFNARRLSEAVRALLTPHPPHP